ncbi:hypothetical protein RRG08_033182 [Elysia crispata]|uniref:Uncharacterized protein n=1 Tax=Elysia crispata TaxID=231223 RepID=A0AAE1BA82_9GAST|nr:hypothetical protein RRG08_033182 [Elysia crispata]
MWTYASQVGDGSNKTLQPLGLDISAHCYLFPLPTPSAVPCTIARSALVFYMLALRAVRSMGKDGGNVRLATPAKGKC